RRRSDAHHPARPARGLVRRGDVRAEPGRAHGGERGQGRLRPRLRGAPPGALPQGRGRPAHGGAWRADRDPRRLDVERPRARDRRRRRGAGPDPRVHDRKRRLVAGDRGRQPALPQPGQGVRGGLRDRPGALHPAARAAGLPDHHADLERGGRRPVRGQDLDHLHGAHVRRARRLARQGEPGPARVGPPDGHRPRPARLVQPRPRQLGRDPRAGGRHAREPGRAGDVTPVKGPAMTETLTETPARNYVGGEWLEAGSGETYEKRDPWRPSTVTGVFQSSSADDAHGAVAAAAAAFPAWAALPAPARAAFFHRTADAIEARTERIARDMTAEMGKPLREARMEAARAATILRFSAGEAWRPVGDVYAASVPLQRLYTVRRPVGVVGLITPWNFPIAIPVWKLAPALIHGNTVVLKLAHDAPRTGLHVAECFAEAGLPAGVLNVLTGSGSKVGAALVESPDVRAISFTGSVEVGHGVRAAATARGCRVQLELGGQNPFVVMADAELDRAVEAAYAGAFWSAGQQCTAARRILVQEAAYDDFRDRLLARVGAGKVGDPTDPETEVGPLVGESARDDVLGAIERGRDEGGTVLAGGERGDGEGFLVTPTVFEGVADDAHLSCEEVFGPVTALYRFAVLDEAITRANAVEYGLSASIFTRDLHAVQRFSEELQAGILHVNSQTAGADVHVPFGGLKGSGYGPHE